VLFKRSCITRQALQYQRFKPGSTLPRQVQQLCPGAARSLPARRSVFLRQGAPLLVMEVFVANRFGQRVLMARQKGER
jgi:chorismate-pyruvate lyase